MIIYEEILRKFQRERVKYVIVGGIAFNLLGGYRNTLDLDILVKMTDSNLLKIVKILKKAGYRPRQPVDADMIADKNTRKDWIENKNMKAFNFYKSAKSYEEVDIIIDSPVGYEKAKKSALKIRAGRLSLAVISPDNFIKMKKASGRDRDLRDIEELKMIRNVR